VRAWRALQLAGLQKYFNWGAAAPGVAPQRPTNYQRVVSEEGQTPKARPEPARAERRE
jgi:hypothetical protein